MSRVRALGLARTVTGAALLWGSAAAAGYAITWTMRSHNAAATVMHAARANLSTSRVFDAAASCRAGTPSVGQLAGVLEIPKIALRAPVEQGETDAVLAAAVGHDSSSVWPGTDGTSVLAAHDVSWFARIGLLRPGDRVSYVSACRTVTFEVTGHRIVPSGSPVQNSGRPTLVLDTCWPNNALWWTPDRELITAVEVSSTPASSASSSTLSVRAQPSASSSALSQPVGVPAPQELVATGLTLDTNATLLGTMSVVGHPSSDFVQSPEPLSVEQAALTAYFGAWHAITSGRTDWWRDLAPSVAFPQAITGSAIGGYVTRLAVRVTAVGSAATGAVLSAEVDLRSAGGAVTAVPVTVNCAIHHGTLVVSGFSVQK